MAEREPHGAPSDAFPTVAYQKQRVQLVAEMLCSLDDVAPGGPSWGAYLAEAARHVAAFDLLNLHAAAVADAQRGATTGH